ncbi:acyltransferase family protein [Echinimonas agarilytica]|uniref:Acyltransferase n=1 Tax=Echinimonas agarilytica TaxID=1215918 RepID=A0AA41WBX2_9GAMM|nr:acyltransferase [Echinimonas agarilytica]MCM2681483.1 acyltransferase [Echinimonas agarilytica]
MFGTYRTLLALMVVALHLGGFKVMGGYAVFGFYMLSGYLMTLIMQESYGYSIQGVRKYAANRFLRIFPSYWFSVALSIALIAIVGNEFSTNYLKSLDMPGNAADWFRNIFLFFPFQEAPRLTPPAWALTVEIFFYILIGLGLSRSKRIVYAWFVLSLIYHVIAYVNNWSWEHRYFSIFAASLPFSAGALIYHTKRKFSSIDLFKPLFKATYAPHLIFTGILVNWLLGFLMNDQKGLFFGTNFWLCFLMLLSLVDRKSIKGIRPKIDKVMGDFSYPIYLTHYQVGLAVVYIASQFDILLARPSIELMAISLIPLCFVSLFLIYGIDHPVEKVRRYIKSRKSTVN